MTPILILQHPRPDGEVDTYHLKAGRRYHIGRGSQCQVRILDLKLSRSHCAIEHAGDGGWQLVDLASTNGCALDGARVSGSRPLHPGAVITAGSTTLKVERIGEAAELDPGPAGGGPAAPVEQVEAEQTQHSDRLAAAAVRAGTNSDELEPQSAPSRANISDPLIPGTAPAPAAAPAPAPASDQDLQQTLAPGVPAPAPAAAAPAADEAERTFHITVLGRRVGPLTRAQARELKTKEMKGTLIPADLAAYEAQAALAGAPADAAPAPPAPPDEARTYYITLLGQRVGPLTRAQARELKARELKGSLGQDEIDRLVAR